MLALFTTAHSPAHLYCDQFADLSSKPCTEVELTLRGYRSMASKVASAACALPSLRTLRLSGRMGVEGAEAIAGCVAQLELLQLWEGAIGDAGVAKLARALVAAPHKLQTLHLQRDSAQAA